MYKVMRFSKTDADISLLSQCVKQAIGRSISQIRDNRPRKSENEGFALTLLDAIGNVTHEDDLLNLYPAENHISFGYLFIIPEAICLEFISYLKSSYICLDTLKPAFKIIMCTQTLNQWEQTIYHCSESGSGLYEDTFKQVYDELKSNGLTRHWKAIHVS